MAQTIQQVIKLLLDVHSNNADPHIGYQKESEKGATNGYAGLGATSLVPMAQLASGAPNGSKFIRDDNTLQVVTASVTDPNPQSFTPGSFTVPAGKYVILMGRMQTLGVERVVVQGTGRIKVL